LALRCEAAEPGNTSKPNSADAPGSPTLAATADQAEAANSGKKYALLVGCTKYYNHDAWQLQGPANDVKLLRQVLVNHFGFDDKQGDKYVVTLAEGSDDDHHPTKANIQREFDRLASEARSGDQVVILLSGHGSRQPEQDSADPEAHKLDGLDEMFLPADTGRWDEAKQSVTNVILDHELHRWIDRITGTGAHVWVIVDSCHSGTMLRGTDAEKIRQVPPESMFVPHEALVKAREKARQRAASAPVIATAEADGSSPKLSRQMKNRVGLYAAQPSEPAPEMPLPDGAADARPQGLLTYTVCELLTPKADGVRPALTYRELGERIRQQYAAWGRTAPTPLVEGGDLDREVLGMKQWPGRSRIVLTQDGDGQWRINAGALLGLNQDSILAVYDPRDASDKPVGYAKVTEVGVASSAVSPCAFEQTAKNEKLTPGSRCELAFVNYDARPLKLAVEELHPAASGPNQSEIDQLRQALAPLEKETGSLVQLIADLRQATWRLQVDGEQCFLVPRSGLLQRGGDSEKAASEGPLFGPFDRDPKTLLPALRMQLGRIAQAQALINLTEQPAGELAQDPDAVSIGIDMVRFKNLADKTGEVLHPGTGIELRAGQRVAFRLKNTSQRAAIYPTLLFIDSRYNITPIYPEEGEVVESLPHGESLTTVVQRVTAKTVGREQLVAIAVEANGPPVDFSGFAQSSLQEERDVKSDRGEMLRSPLGQLLEQALYRTGTARGMERADIEQSALGHIVWETRPEEK
jgi:hypothetical protein